LWVNSATNWGVYSTQPNTSGVKSYPNDSKSVGTALNSLHSATSSFSESNPGSGNWESAYDIWLNGSGVRSGSESSGSVNLLDMLKYLENTKGYFSNPTLPTVQYGWEISSTGNTQLDFTINSYSVSTS